MFIGLLLSRHMLTIWTPSVPEAIFGWFVTQILVLVKLGVSRQMISISSLISTRSQVSH